MYALWLLRTHTCAYMYLVLQNAYLRTYAAQIQGRLMAKWKKWSRKKEEEEGRLENGDQIRSGQKNKEGELVWMLKPLFFLPAK